MFKDKTLLITGGTGSFGNAVLERFLKSDLKEIRIFSRDEKKQDDRIEERCRRTEDGRQRTGRDRGRRKTEIRGQRSEDTPVKCAPLS